MKPENVSLGHDLIDTQWYALTINDPQFEEIIQLRKDQGFNAVQLVIGVPPEVGPEHPRVQNAAGEFPWNLQNEPNLNYLEFARQRAKQINELGMTAYIYGAWGHQIDWYEETGVELMKNWWEAIVETVDDLDVVYCVTGEANLWIDNPNRLLPDLSLGDTLQGKLRPHVHPTILYWRRQITNRLLPPEETKISARYEKWNQVLEFLSQLTQKPILIHTHPGITSHDIAHEENRHLLAAVTWQTGHKYQIRHRLHQLPLQANQDYPGIPSGNLEPWYEGLDNRFWADDQLYAYWISRMAGTDLHAYGAQGVWNGNTGDGHLDHWGKQTMQQAMALPTPGLIGVSHAFFEEHGFGNFRGVSVEEGSHGRLISITRSNGLESVVYYPDISKHRGKLPTGNIFLPLTGQPSPDIPLHGPVVFYPQP